MSNGVLLSYVYGMVVLIFVVCGCLERRDKMCLLGILMIVVPLVGLFIFAVCAKGWNDELIAILAVPCLLGVLAWVFTAISLIAKYCVCE